MLLFELLAERRIEEAAARGELDNLPGSGRPLDLEDDALVPEDLRLVHRILKNAGFVPPEVEALKKLNPLLVRLRIESGYYEKALRKLKR